MEDPMAEPGIDVANLPQIAALMTLAVAANAREAPLEGGGDPAFGTERWRTLFSGDRRPTRGMVPGIAEFGLFGALLPRHGHGHEKICFGLSGGGVVTIDGVPHPLGPEVALYVPATASPTSSTAFPPQQRRETCASAQTGCARQIRAERLERIP